MDNSTENIGAIGNEIAKNLNEAVGQKPKVMQVEDHVSNITKDFNKTRNICNIKVEISLRVCSDKTLEMKAGDKAIQEIDDLIAAITKRLTL